MHKKIAQVQAYYMMEIQQDIAEVRFMFVDLEF